VAIENEIKPAKRPVSSMTPTLVLHAKGSRWFALASPGSATIPNSVFQVIINSDAEPGAIVFDVAEELRSAGYTINPKLRWQGDVHAVMIEEGTGWRLGWLEGRRGGRTVGF
jgi:gamma-glutamyltranspeptidase / glutathione hydrolase